MNRSLWLLVVAVAAASMSMYATWPIASVAAVDMGDRDWLSGIPGALGILGTSLSSLVLGRMMARHGRRWGLRAGWIVAFASSALGFVAITEHMLSLLLLAMLGIGIGNAATILARYAAAEFVGKAAKASAISMVVWASTVGAIGGPTLAASVGSWLESFGHDPASGAFVVACSAQVIALALTLMMSDPVAHEVGSATSPALELGTAATNPVARVAVPEQPLLRDARAVPMWIAITSLVVCQAGMVMPMAGTPIHLSHEHFGHGTIGVVMSSHFAGMFALSPLVGLLIARIGELFTLTLGVALLGISGAMSGLMTPGLGMTVPLFLLGVGWSCSFIAATSVISKASKGVASSGRQGNIDALIWLSAAAASLSSGFLIEWVSYDFLGSATFVAAGITIVVFTVSRAVTTRRYAT